MTQVQLNIMSLSIITYWAALRGVIRPLGFMVDTNIIIEADVGSKFSLKLVIDDYELKLRQSNPHNYPKIFPEGQLTQNPGCSLDVHVGS